uniref:G-protein coupled receptors family 1 profile domain-containing protein n=1 Tax=Anabas testudineus TaxID=64144 RepID=A0A3Q1JPL1_ANATE
MNTTENDSIIYLDYYTDYNYTCNQDSSPDGSSGFLVLPLLYYMLCCLGLLGNIIVLWVLLRHIKLRTMTDVCLLNLALSDFILAVSLPLWVYNSQSLASCKLMTGVYQLGFYSGTLFVTLMSVDRYLAIVHAVAAIITIWVVSVILATPQVTFADLEIDPDDNSFQCQPLYPEDSQLFWKMLRNFTENTVGLFVCLPIMIFCFVKILIVLSKSRNSKKDKAVKLIFIVVCLFVVCWVPYNVTVFLQTLELLGILNTFEASRNISTAMSFAEIIALSHCCVNPVIYVLIGEKFRKSLSKVLTRSFCWNHQSRGAFSLRDTTDKETSNTPVRSDY